MFPTIDNPFQQKNKRRPRNDPNNRDYICPCGKSYLSYPALFTHIKTKHNGRAPGQIIKPRSENNGRRGRPKARQACDSESQTEDIASNALDRLCDFVTEIQKNQAVNLKDIYSKDSFYDIYLNFNHQQQQPKYNEIQDIFEQSCDNVFSQFIAEFSKRINQPYYVDTMFIFITILSKSINQDRGNPKQITEEPIRNLAEFMNKFFIQYLPLYRESFKLELNPMFNNQNMGKLLEQFCNWLLMKKYLSFKVKMDMSYFKGN